MNYKEFLNLYEILEIKVGASNEEIKSAYVRKAKQYHPDKYMDIEDKKMAETNFKMIKEAYDYLISAKGIEQDDFSVDNQVFRDLHKRAANYTPDDQPDIHINENDDFFKYYVFKKYKYFEYQQDDEKFNYKTEAIAFFKKYIKDNKLSLIFVYECIKNNKAISKLSDDFTDLREFNETLMKEAIYRRSIKESKVYKGFLKREAFYKNIDVEANLKVNANYGSKRFNEVVSYQIYKICPSCHGLSCKKCQDGLVTEEKKTLVRINLVSKKMKYEITNAGHRSPLGNGKLKITVTYNKENTKAKNRYSFKTLPPKVQDPKNVVMVMISQLAIFMNLSLEFLVQAFAATQYGFSQLWSHIVKNKHLSALYLVILLLVIAIICMGVLL
ncbi:MAG: J domain-containing protein [Mycoplasma sp.]